MIDGSKQFITNSGTDITSFVTVTARTGTRDNGKPEISAIVVPAGTPGFEVGRLRQAGLARLRHTSADLRDVRVPEEHCWASVGRDTSAVLVILDDGRVAIAALALGCIRACLEMSTQYALQRTSFGVPIGRKQGVAFQIADLDVMASAAHQLVYAAAAMRDQGTPVRGSSTARLRSPSSTRPSPPSRAARIATQVFGGYGFMEEYPVARFYRDAKVLEIGEGTSEVQRMLDRPPARAPGGVVESWIADVAAARGRASAPSRPPTRAAGQAGERRTSSSSATGSRCCSTRAPSSRTASWPTRWLPDLPADGVVTGRGLVEGRPALVVANDPSVKAGSWGARTVEKIIRMTEVALRDELPIFWFIDSAGARITDQVELFPGRRGAGRIFHNQVALSGKVPQICCLFGPQRGRRRLHPGLLRRGDHGRGQRVDVPRLAPDGRDGGRGEGHAGGDGRRPDARHGLRLRRPAGGRRHRGDRAGEAVLLLLAAELARPAPDATTRPSRRGDFTDDLVPAEESAGYDIRTVIDGDRRRRLASSRSSRCSRPSWSPASPCSKAKSIGIVANQPAVKGGVLFVDSADKAARFIWLCDAFNIPLLFLADVPGFMIGSEVERQGIIRHGAKMITAVAEATVPKISVIVRKAYGAGLYAMCGPGFAPDACLALPTAKIAVMGPEAAVNAVYANKIAAIDDDGERAAYVARLREPSTRPTSTSCGWPASWSSTRSSSRVSCAHELIAPLRRRGDQGPALLDPAPRRAAGLERQPESTGASVGNRAPPHGGGASGGVLSSASDDDGGGFQVGCVSAPKLKRQLAEQRPRHVPEPRHHRAHRRWDPDQLACGLDARRRRPRRPRPGSRPAAPSPGRRSSWT